MIKVAIIIAIVLAIYCYNMKKKSYNLKHKHDNEPPYAPFKLDDEDIKLLRTHGNEAMNPYIWGQRLGCLILCVLILTIILIWEM